MKRDFSTNHVLETVDELAVSMDDVSDEIRLQVFERLKADFCDKCGAPHPVSQKCQCWNDE